MGGSSMMCLWLMASLLWPAQPSPDDQSPAACWAGIQEEEEVQPSPAAEDYATMAHFIAEFAKLINVNEIYFCVMEEVASADRVIERIFASALSRHMVFYLSCDLPRMWENIKTLDEAITVPEGGVMQSQFQPAALHVTSRRGLAATLASLWKQEQRDYVTANHIVLGVDLPQCQSQFNATARWFQASYNMSSREVLMEEVYLFGDGKESLNIPVTRWSSHGEKAAMTILHQPSLGPEDFKGHVVKATAIPYSPHIMKLPVCNKSTSLNSVARFENHCTAKRLEGVMVGKSGEVKEKGEYGGYLVDIILTLAAALNFRVKLSILPPEDDEFGVDQGDGTYSGLVGALQSLRADVALAGLSMTRERFMVMDFSQPVAYTGMTLYVATNSSLHTIGWNTYVLSFHWGTWLAIILLLAVMTFGFWVIVRHQRDEDPHFNHGQNIAFIFYSCLVQQGSWILPTTARAQAVLWMFWFSSVVLYASYTARLTSFLTVSTIKLPFTSLDQALTTPGWKIGILKGTATIRLLQRSKYKKVYEEMVRNPSLFINSNQEALDLILTDSKFAYFSDKLVMSYLLNGNCSATEIPGNHFAGYFQLGLRKRLPYATVINRELTKMASGGLLDRLQQRWWGKPIPCEDPSPYTELGFTNILTAFLLLLAGFILSLLLLVAELSWKQLLHYASASSPAGHGTLAKLPQGLYDGKLDKRYPHKRAIKDIKRIKQMTSIGN